MPHLAERNYPPNNVNLKDMVTTEDYRLKAELMISSGLVAAIGARNSF